MTGEPRNVVPAEGTTTTEPTNLDLALGYARRGWRVVPIPPREKFPRGITAWQTEGSTDEAKITHWWTQAPDHGIGIVTGATSGLWVLDVDVAGDKVGDETLAYLTDDHTPLPDTYEVITGSGGRHLYFAWPTDQIITNSASGRLGPGLDVRGEGGFVVAPPSLHANGNRYEVEASAPDHVAPAPKWLLAMLEEPAPVIHKRFSPQDLGATGDRPGDLWAAATTWAQILTPDGWTLHHTSRDGEEHWTRPGKERRDGTSATTGYKDSDVLKVFTSSHPVLAADETYTKLGYLAATKHNGDHAAAARALAADGWRTTDTNLSSILPPGTTTAHPETEEAIVEAERADWAPIDLTAVLAGDHHPPVPTILAPHGTLPLIYPGRANAVFGESGAGKTWVALAAIVEVLETGNVAMLIDLEDTSHGITSRLLALGVDQQTILSHFIYLAPQTGWGPVAQASVATLIDHRQPQLVVLDSTGEAMAASGVKGNDDDDVARWFVTFPKFIARRGPAVLIIDHVPKDPNAPTKYMIGSQRKTAAIDGASYRVDAVKAPSKTADGLLKIIVAKDRHGTRSQGDIAAMVALSHDLIGGVTIALTAPDAMPVDPQGNPRHTIYMERISRALEATPGLSGREIETRVEGKAKLIRDALRTLMNEGYAELGETGRFNYRMVRPFREAEDGKPVTSTNEHNDTEGRCGTRPNDAHHVDTPLNDPSDVGLKGVVPHRPASSLHHGDAVRPSSPPLKGGRGATGDISPPTASPPEGTRSEQPDTPPPSTPIDAPEGSLLA